MWLVSCCRYVCPFPIDTAVSLISSPSSELSSLYSCWFCLLSSSTLMLCVIPSSVVAALLTTSIGWSKSSGINALWSQKGMFWLRVTSRKKRAGTWCTDCTRCLQIRNRLVLKLGHVQTQRNGSGLYFGLRGAVMGVVAHHFHSRLNALRQDGNSRKRPLVSNK
jgi:hypothetical protein